MILQHALALTDAGMSSHSCAATQVVGLRVVGLQCIHLLLF